MKAEQPWIGLVHVQPKAGINPLGQGLKGAFVHVLALATSSELYRDRALRALDAEGFYVLEFSDVSPLTKYRKDDRVSEEMEELVSSLSVENPVQFDTFDAYREHDT